MDISWNFRWTFWPGNYIWSLPLLIWTQMRHLGTLIPRFCTEFWYLLYGQSGLAWGAIFEKVPRYQEQYSCLKICMSIFQEQVPKMSFSPSVHRQLPWLVLQYFQIHRLYQNDWSFSISRYTSYTKVVGFSVFPDSQVLNMVGFSIFPGPNHFGTTDDPKFTFICHDVHIFHLFGQNSISSLLNTVDITMQAL